MGEQHPRDTVAHPANGCAECREPLLDSLSADPTTTASLVKWVCGAIFDTYGSAPGKLVPEDDLPRERAMGLKGLSRATARGSVDSVDARTPRPRESTDSHPRPAVDTRCHRVGHLAIPPRSPLFGHKDERPLFTGPMWATDEMTLA
jgi:hypothetical protein